MKRILISLLLCPITMMANSNEPLYVGVLTHLISEAIFDGRPYIFPCKEDKIVYQYDEKQNRFDFVVRHMNNYVNPANTLPEELSSIDFHISDVQISNTDKQPSARIIATFDDNQHIPSIKYITDGTHQMGVVTRFAPPKNRDPRYRAPNCGAVFQVSSIDSTPVYRPGVTSKILEKVTPAMILEKVAPAIAIDINEPITDHVTAARVMLGIPQPHPVAIVVAFLKLQKQNDEYIPVPSELCQISKSTL